MEQCSPPVASLFANLLWVLNVLGDDLHLNLAIEFAHLRKALLPREEGPGTVPGWLATLKKSVL